MDVSEKITVSVKRVKLFYASSGIKMRPEFFILAFFLAASCAALLAHSMGMPFVNVAAAFVAVSSLAVLIPFNARSARVNAIEDLLPDAIKQMALVLKAGGTSEDALKEVVASSYGPVSEELAVGLRELQEGKPFNQVLFDRAESTGSPLFKRVAGIIISARKAGAGLSDILLEIAGDARDLMHIRRERYSRTTMHVIFLVSSLLFIAPFIFGFSISIVHYINQGIAGALPNAPKTSLCGLNLLFSLFIVFEGVFTSIALGIVREGKAEKYLLYAPAMVLTALIIFEAGKWLSTAIVGGASIAC